MSNELSPLNRSIVDLNWGGHVPASEDVPSGLSNHDLPRILSICYMPNAGITDEPPNVRLSGDIEAEVSTDDVAENAPPVGDIPIADAENILSCKDVSTVVPRGDRPSAPPSDQVPRVPPDGDIQRHVRRRDVAVVLPVGDVPRVLHRGEVSGVSRSGDRNNASDSCRSESAFDPTLVHRLDFARFASENSEESRREILKPVYAGWRRWNRRYFRDLMVVPHILILEPSNPQALADYQKLTGWGSVSQIRIRPSVVFGSHPDVREGDEYFEGRLLLVLDLALAQTIHQYKTETLEKPERSYHGHGPIFRDLCNEIGEELGLGPVRTAKERGRDRHLPSCSNWPMNVRPLGFYRGAYEPNNEESSLEADGEETTPILPRKLRDWIEANPEWAELYRKLGVVVNETLDQFFDANPTPPKVQKQAVAFIAKSYNYQLRSRVKASVPARLP